CPDVHWQVAAVGDVDEALVDQDALADVGRHLDTPAREPARAGAVARHAQAGDPGRTEGRADASTAQAPDPAETTVGEGSDAHAIDGLAALECVDERTHGRVVLGIDV